MTIKVVVLYPQPVDAAAFEARYHSEHMPLIHRLMGGAHNAPTFKTVAGTRGGAPFYRMAELHFADRATLDAFARSPGAEIARASSERLSTGGPPLVFVCERDP